MKNDGRLELDFLILVVEFNYYCNLHICNLLTEMRIAGKEARLGHQYCCQSQFCGVIKSCLKQEQEAGDLGFGLFF